MDAVINGQRVLPDGTAPCHSVDKRVSKNPEGYPPSQDQQNPAIASSDVAGHALVVWHDTGHYNPDTDSGIWGRFWVPTEQVMLPLVLRGWP